MGGKEVGALAVPGAACWTHQQADRRAGLRKQAAGDARARAHITAARSRPMEGAALSAEPKSIINQTNIKSVSRRTVLLRVEALS